MPEEEPLLPSGTFLRAVKRIIRRLLENIAVLVIMGAAIWVWDTTKRENWIAELGGVKKVQHDRLKADVRNLEQEVKQLRSAVGNSN